jgi:SH3 domain-containing YSC84-like protein 1
MQSCAFVLAAIACAAVEAAAIGANETARLESAAAIVKDVHAAISAGDWTRARCVVVVPAVKKAAFAAGQPGNGAVSCRAGDRWSAPLFVQLMKASSGFQLAAPDAEVVLLVLNEEGAQKLLQATATVGAEIVSYARTRGVFARIDLAGATLRADTAANASVYGSGATPRTILASREISAPTGAQAFLQALNAPAATDRPAAADRGVATDRAGSVPATPRATTGTATDDDARARAIDLQQEIDRLLADTTPAPVGTAGATASAATVTVDRARLLHLRQQLDALIAALNRR